MSINGWSRRQLTVVAIFPRRARSACCQSVVRESDPAALGLGAVLAARFIGRPFLNHEGPYIGSRY